MNFEEIFEFVETHQEEFSEDELLALSFLCSSLAQDRRMAKEEEEKSFF